MIFTSIPFLWFFLVILIGLCVLQRRDHRQALILAGSIFFYAQSRLSHLLILAAPSLIDYVCAKRIEDAVRQSARKRWLLASLTTNLGLLAYFKYANFFIANVSALWPAPIGSLDV